MEPTRVSSRTFLAVSPRVACLLPGVLALGVLLPGTFGVSLVDRDEGWYAQVSREMLESGDWLMPRYLGEPWLAKPPLLYWCVAASFRVLGLHEWAGRLVSVLAMVGVVCLVVMLTREMYDRRVAVFAGVTFITAGLPAVVGKMLLTDGLLLLGIMAATVLLWRIAVRGPTVLRAVRFWAAVGLAILTKGPAVVLFVAALGVGLLVYTRTAGGGGAEVRSSENLAAQGRGQATRPGQGTRWVVSPVLWLTLPVAVVIAAPWYVYVAQRAGGTLVSQFFGYEIVSRIIGTPHGHGGPPGYHLLVGLAGWLPWTVLVPGAVIEAWRGRRDDRVAGLMLVWAGLPWLVLELIHSKLPHYVLPCYVPLAILLGRMWANGLDGETTRFQRFVLGVWAAVPLLLGVMAVAAGVVWRAETWSAAPAAAGVPLLAGFAVVGWLVWRARLRAAWVAAVGTAWLFHVVLGLGVLPALEPYRLSRLVAARVNAVSEPTTEVLACGYDEPSLFFYLERPARVMRVETLPEALRPGPQPRVVIARDESLRQAGLRPASDAGVWLRVRGFNYVKGRHEILWIVPVPAAESACANPRRGSYGKTPP